MEAQNIITETGDEFWQCDTCNGIQHLNVSVVGVVTPSCAPESPCGGVGTMVEITEAAALEELS